MAFACRAQLFRFAVVMLSLLAALFPSACCHHPFCLPPSSLFGLPLSTFLLPRHYTSGSPLSCFPCLPLSSLPLAAVMPRFPVCRHHVFPVGVRRLYLAARTRPGGRGVSLRCRCGHKYLVLNRGMNLASCAAGINQHYYLRENNLYNIRSISCVVCRCRSDGPSQERGAGACGRYRDAVGDHRRRLSRPQVHRQTSRRHRLLGPLPDQSGETLLDARR